MPFCAERFATGFGAKVLKGEVFCGPKGDEVVVAFGEEEFANGFGAKGLKGDTF